MERNRRVRQPNKASVALDAIRAVRSGERKALDTLESDEDAREDMDDEAHATDEDEHDDVAVPSKRKQAGERLIWTDFALPLGFPCVRMLA
jgi:hypothetical protein